MGVMVEGHLRARAEERGGQAWAGRRAEWEWSVGADASGEPVERGKT